MRSRFSSAARNVVEARIKRYGLSMEVGRHFELVNPEDDPRYRDYVATYVEAAGRKGITPDAAKTLVRTNSTVIGALAVRRGDADALICGLEGRFRSRLKHIKDIIGLSPGVQEMAALSLVITPKGAYFLADTHVQPDPNAEEIADMTIACASHVRRFGLEPKIALLSHADFGAAEHALGPQDARCARSHPGTGTRTRSRWRDAGRRGVVGDDPRTGQSRIRGCKGEANILIMPNLDAANIAFQFSKILADSLPVGPILIGPAKPAHVLTPSVTARGIVNLTAIAVVEAQAAEEKADAASAVEWAI